MARRGEALARAFLERRGVVVRTCNARVGRYEVDIVGVDGDELVGFEVKTVVSRHPNDDGIHQVSSRQLQRVRDAVRHLGSRSGRVDVVTVRFDPSGAAVRWLRDARW